MICLKWVLKRADLFTFKCCETKTKQSLNARFAPWNKKRTQNGELPLYTKKNHHPKEDS